MTENDEFASGSVRRTSLTAAQRHALEQQLIGRGGTGTETIPRRESKDVAPLSFAQERLWFFEQLHPNGSLYNVPFVLRIRVPLRVPVLERALNEIVRRHETLRTHFEAQDGKPVQRIASEATVPLVVSDLQALPANEREAAAQTIAAQEAAHPFDLGRAPLLRARLVRLSESDQVILLTLHHIVSDGWSMRVLYRELGVLYAAFDAGRPSPLGPLPIQYADFALWQRNWLQGDTLAAQLTYWRTQLEGAPAVLTLPTDRPRPAVQSYRGGLLPFTIDAGPTSALRALAQEEGATLFMAIAAALQLFLCRYSGQHDIAIGTPIANRTRAEFEDLIGFFVNTLVLRTRMNASASFRALLTQVRETTLAAYAHQDLPFERLVEDLQPERTLGHNPLFQVMLLFQAATGAPRAQAAAAEPAESAPPEVLTGTAKFDLTFALGDMGDTLSGVIEYASDLFDPATVEMMAGHFVNLVGAIAAAPDAPMEGLVLIGDDERRRLLTGLDESAEPAERLEIDSTIDVLVGRRAQETPDAPALEFADATLSYGELEARANRLARLLRARGVGLDTRVGLWIDRSAALVVSMLAVWKAGGVFVALDTRSPPERLASMLTDAGVTLVIVGRCGEIPLTEGVSQLDLEEEAGAIAMRSAQALKRRNMPGQLAQIIFTSGSTGKPKGVMIEHGQLLWLLDAMRSAALGINDRLAQTSSAAFDVMAYECWGALTAGACLVGIEREALLIPDRLAATLEQRRITVLYQTSALFGQIVAHRPDAYLGARLLLVGGDRVDPHKVRAAMQASRLPVFMHTYGPTETTVFCSIQTLTAPPPDGQPLSIGPALPHARLYVVDRAGRLAPTGTVGEVLIGGACLARGYVGRPDLTAERFMPDPFGAEPGARLYRTGDLARLRPDGILEFLGRADGQVKIRGYRIEPSEVDAVLRTHPAVRTAVTVCVGGPDNPHLVAYVVPADAAQQVDDDTLRRHCKRLLPEYMVPAHFVALDALPITANGKLDRSKLPEPGARPRAGAALGEPPRGETERAVAAIWGRILGMEQIARTDRFFDIGGHSLLATQVISRLRDELGAEVSLRTIFEMPTVAELACAIDELRASDPSPVSEPQLVSVPRAVYRTRRAGAARSDAQ